MYKSITLLISLLALFAIGCRELDRESAEENERTARLEAIIEAILHDWGSPKEYGEELLEDKDAAQKVWEESIYFNVALPISIEKVLLFSYFRWEYFDRAYRLAEEIGDGEIKTLVRFIWGECLEVETRALFRNFTASMQPGSVPKSYTDEPTYIRNLFTELMAGRTYLQMREREGAVPTVFPEPRGVLYLVSYRAKEKGLCELAEILHEFARVELGLWDIGLETDYEELSNLRVAAAGEPLGYFRLASILAEFFMDCGNVSYAEFWWKQAFRLHSALREKEDGNRYYKIHRHLYKKMTESVPAEMMPLLREPQ